MASFAAGSTNTEENANGDFYDVEKIEKMRYHHGQLEFFVTWTVGGQTWEPIRCFPWGVEHLMIQEFKTNNKKRWDQVMKQKEKAEENMGI
ncbi:hypothetical protein GCK72_005363 [Caenorhabditis remanei]|uniref:Uncharacterized protein n=1 Tax=Caenorhabditis remanei TaxID=31234 RepID=A0A2P4WGK5_CAERE|nr:hypothetical protein GCK72_005363 [Caenorhabditis remanei]KAF1765411.1 hypothetical protein GCK72_005363 [Caenorhabditis remanei]